MLERTGRAAVTGSVVPLMLVMLVGCFSLGRDSPPLEQYVLGGDRTTAAAVSSPNATGLTLGLRRLDLAPYLATPAIVVRRGAREIMTSDFHRWGEDPRDGINRAVARHLAARTSVRAVDVAPWPVRSSHDYLVRIHVSRFEGVTPDDPTATNGEAHVLATWEIIRSSSGEVLFRGATDYRVGGWTVGDYAHLVALLDRGLDQLTGDLISSLERLGPGS
jgi:uncharacterized lipoprotein YmbA